MIETRNLPVVLASDGSLNAYIRKVNSIPILTLEEENNLTERFWKHMDFGAAQKLVLSHLRLVIKIAKSFKSYDLPIQDIISEGNIGLMKAVQKFSPDVGCRLATYASWWIRAAIQEYILNSWSMIKVSTNAMRQKLFYKLRQTKDYITKLAGFVKEEDLQLAQIQTVSLDEPMSDGNSLVLMDTIQSQDDSYPEMIMKKEEDKERKELLQKGIEELNDREKDILYRRRLKQIPDKLGDIAKEYGISSERVRQIEDRVMSKLKTLALQHNTA
jgi:RNA polymerase sigma-32 factor